MAYTTINDPTAYFQNLIWSGNNSDNRALTFDGNSNLQADMTWFKGRTIATDHKIIDSVRGVTKQINSNNSNAEATDSTLFKSFNSNGITIGTGGAVNDSGQTYCSWNWKANGQGVANTDGSINTTYTSANITAGFSIIKYAGTGSSGTIGHGLSATPKVLLIKEIDGAEGWRVWHRNAPNYSTQALQLNSNSAEFSQTNWIGTVDNSIITLGTDSSINTSGNNYICYAFAEKQGYSKFGSYTGNASTDGTFVYTGFKPAYVMLKQSSGTEGWYIFDNTRDTFNLVDDALTANTSNTEITNWGVGFDFLSNGFKARATDASINSSGGSYIYMCFAEAPLVGTNNVPCTAR
jgi:hypothetical protein